MLFCPSILKLLDNRPLTYNVKELFMYNLEKEFKFEYAHRLMFHNGPCKNLHGHSARIKVDISANNLNDAGMIIDFGHLGFINDYFDDNYDHTLILNEKDPLLDLLQNSEESHGLKIKAFTGEPTSENFANVIAHDIGSMLIEKHLDIIGLKITFWETVKNSASYTLKEDFFK